VYRNPEFMKPSYWVVIFLLLPITAFSQKSANPERAKALKALPSNKKASIVGYQYKSNYAFDVGGDNVTVVNSEQIDLISVEGNIDYMRAVYYNDHVEVVSSDVKFATGKTLKSQKVCGNYEVDDVFYSDAKMCSYRFNFLHEGTEISFRSKVKFDDPKYLTKVFIHDDVPVESREITFTIPNSLSVDLIEKNFEGFNISKTVTSQGNAKVYKYTAKNLKALHAERNSLGILYHYPHILVVTKDYISASGKRNIIASVNDLYKWYSSLAHDVQNDSKPFENHVIQLINGAKTPEEKIKAIYYWVQDNIKYIAFEDGIAGFKPDAAQNVYNNRYGDCKGMANLTKEMLKVAGFDARLTWIGTNRIPYTYDVPTLAVDNHMICTVFLGEKQYILDSTEKYIALGKHAERIQGKEMLIENGDAFVVKKVPVADFNNNLVARNETMTIEGETLKGQGELNMNGEAKTQMLYYSNYIKTEDKSKLFNDLAVSDISNTDKVEILNTPPVDREKPLEIKYNYSLTNKVSKFGSDIYVQLDWNKTFADLKMEEDRETDYYFNRKVKQKVVKKFKVPAGYRVSHLPKGIKKISKDYSIDVSFKQTGNEVLYTNEITITDGILRKINFNTWNESIKELNDLYNDQLVITKTK
jgi:hypothetical protein